MGTYITTYSGIRFDLLNPTVDMVKIEDIAHHLAHVCRWAGAVNAFWSVAQHSVIVSRITPPDDLQLCQWALMHDAAEAYIGDITRPLKNILGSAIRDIEVEIEEVIAEKFKLPFPPFDGLNQFDDQMQKFEAETLMRHDGEFMTRDGLPSTLASLSPNQLRRLTTALIRPMTPEAAKVLFMLRYDELFGAIR